MFTTFFLRKIGTLCFRTVFFLDLLFATITAAILLGHISSSCAQQETKCFCRFFSLTQIALRVSVNINFSLIDSQFDLGQNLDCYTNLLWSNLCSSGCIFGVIFLLESDTLPKAQFFCSVHQFFFHECILLTSTNLPISCDQLLCFC